VWRRTRFCSRLVAGTGCYAGASSSRRRYPCVTNRGLSNDRESGGIIAAGLRYRTCHVTTFAKCPYLRKPNPTGLQCASASSLRHFGPVSSSALVAVLVILDRILLNGTPAQPRFSGNVCTHRAILINLMELLSCSAAPYGPLTYSQNPGPDV
jgi:hypothetical protein